MIYDFGFMIWMRDSTPVRAGFRPDRGSGG